jgi:hypothetical protein
VKKLTYCSGQSCAWINGEFTWAEDEKTTDIISGKYEQAVIDTDSPFDGVTFAKRFMFDCDRKKR